MSNPNDTSDFDDLLSLTNDDEPTAAVEKPAETPAEAAPDAEIVEPEQAAAPAQEEVAPVEKPKRTRAPRKPKDTTPEPVTEPTPEQKRIQELEAKLAALDAQKVEIEPTPEQKRIQELEALLAEREQGVTATVENFSAAAEAPHDPDEIVFHFLTDGTIAFGQVWSKGQVIRIRRGTSDWKRTLNRNGVSWIDRFLDNQEAQFNAWGEVRIARGSYRWMPGEEFDVDVARADARRGDRVPVSAITATD